MIDCPYGYTMCLECFGYHTCETRINNVGSYSVNKGLEYENKIRRSFRKLSKGRQTIIRRCGKGGFSQHSDDLVLGINNKNYPIELKFDGRAQIGNMNIGYDFNTQEFSFSDNFIDGDVINEVLNNYKSEINELIKWLKFNENISNFRPKFPLNVSVTCQSEREFTDIIKCINVNIDYDTTFISSYYNKKGIDYIQIGKMGLFYLEDNPLELDIPKLTGDIKIELRTCKSGVRTLVEDNIKYNPISLRAQGRLQFRDKSNINFDNEDDIIKFLDKVER